MQCRGVRDWRKRICMSCNAVWCVWRDLSSIYRDDIWWERKVRKWDREWVESSEEVVGRQEKQRERGREWWWCVAKFCGCGQVPSSSSGSWFWPILPKSNTNYQFPKWNAKVICFIFHLSSSSSFIIINIMSFVSICFQRLIRIRRIQHSCLFLLLPFI